jgi:predicted DNA-binding transcriptional regulator AlpA
MNESQTRARTEREVADMLGLSVATLRAWRHRGQGPRFLRLGRAVRYLPADLEAFVRVSAVDVGTGTASDRRTGIEESRP